MALFTGRNLSATIKLTHHQAERACPLHRRVLQSRQATLSARLPQPNPVRKTGVRLGKCLSTFSRQVHGLDVRLAKEVAEQLMAHDALASHARDELGISDSLAARPLQAAVASAVSFVVGGAVPLRGLDLPAYRQSARRAAPARSYKDRKHRPVPWHRGR